MPPQHDRSPARLLAPAALVVLALAVVVIVLTSSSGGGDDAPRRANTADDATATATAPSTPRRRRKGSTYTVRRDDTLGSIAEQTGIEVERLRELNPQLDPQALIAGQKIKLRE